MNLYEEQVAKMLDVSVLQATNTKSDIEKLIIAARQYQFICIFSLPCYLPDLIAAMKNTPINVGAPIGFPTGAETTQIKAFQAKSLLEIGCKEFDMVMNIGWLKSGLYNKVIHDIRVVRESIGNQPLKVIIEVTYLSDSEIIDACKIVMDSSAEYVKTGTGWAPMPTTMNHIKIMTQTVHDKIKIKAAGGICDYQTICRMYEMGVSRFGVSLKSGIQIMQQIKAANTL